MNLKNYTTRIPAFQSINQIKKILVDFGAIGIMEEYDAKKTISCINFILDVEGYKLPFRLPIKVEATYKWLKNKRKTAYDESELLKQAERVCWKQMLEWVQIQLSLVMLDQAEPLEVFFPFLYDTGIVYTSLGAAAKDNNVSRSAICHVLRGKMKTVNKNTFKYVIG